MATEHEDGSVTFELEDDEQGQGTEGSTEELDEQPADGIDVGGESEQPESAAAPPDEDDDEDEDHPSSRTEQNRLRRQQRKQARKEREDTYRRELQARDSVINQLNERLSTIEQRSTGTEMAHLDNELRNTANAYEHFKEQVKLAIDTNNGQLASDATEKMTMAQRRLEDLSRVKQAYSQRQQAPQPLDPRMVTNAQTWLDRNKWYKADGADTDSRIIRQLDNELTASGWDPRTPEYWKELDARKEKYLPHRSQTGYNAPTSRRTPVGSSERDGGSGAGGSGKSFTVSAERVKALKEAGLYDDPKKRAEAIKRFREYDKANAQR